MSSFRSQHYPRTAHYVTLLQEYALRFYGLFMLVVMIGVVILMNAGKDAFWFGIIGAFVALVLGNFAADVQLHRKIAEIHFVSDSFAVISVHDILTRSHAATFPLRFANPTRTENEIQFHYKDQVMILRRQDWEEFDLIWNWFTQDPGMGSIIQGGIPAV